MSEQQTTTETTVQETRTSACPHPEAVGERWGDPISEERQAELQGYLDRWEAEKDHGGRKGPFDSVGLVGADVFWLVERVSDPRGNASALHLERAGLSRTHLEDANLFGVHLDEASLIEAHLEGADLRFAYLDRVGLEDAHLEGANLRRSHLTEAVLIFAHLEGADLSEANVEDTILDNVHLEGANLTLAHLERATFVAAHLEGAGLWGAHLEGADLRGMHLGGADLVDAHLERANLSDAHLEGKIYQPEDADYQRLTQWVRKFRTALPPANMRGAYMDNGTILGGITLGSAQLYADTPAFGFVYVSDVRWGGVNLAVVDWSSVFELGDERAAWAWRPEALDQPKGKLSRRERVQRELNHQKKQSTEQLKAFRAAVRANRQLAIALRSQGLNSDADRFAYNAQVLERQVLRRQGHPFAALGSWFLDLISGYGYKPMRSLIAYVLIICAFAGAYLLNGQFAAPHLTWDEALVLSVSAFHGRGFFTSGISLGDILARLAAGEAIIGLLIEITFIATFTQRFFAR